MIGDGGTIGRRTAIFFFRRRNICICVELANEDEEVTVLEVGRKNDGGELVRVPNNEAVASSTP